MRGEQAQRIVPETASRQRVGGMRRRLAQALPPLALLSTLIAAWELIVWQLALPAWLLPPPSRVLTTLLSNLPILGEHVAATLTVTIPGFGLALVTGFALGVLIDASPLLRRASIHCWSRRRRCRSWRLRRSWW
jgi:ABC-type nitrate/sulfonate/bicarbonate transport system, permease component